MTYEEAVAAAMIKYPKAKQRAVNNFPSGCGDNGMHNAMNLDADRGHGWNAATVSAIKFVVKKIGKPI